MTASPSCSRSSTYERMLRNARPRARVGARSRRGPRRITRDLLRRNAHDGDAYIRPLVYKSASNIRVKLTPGSTTASDPHDPVRRLPADRRHPAHGVGLAAVSDNAIPARGKISAPTSMPPSRRRTPRRRLRRRHPAPARRRPRGRGVGREPLRRCRAEVATPPLTDDVFGRYHPLGDHAHRGPTPDSRSSSAGSTAPSLYLADEVFLTAHRRPVAPVSSIDDRAVGSGQFPISLDIQRRYFARPCAAATKRYAQWLTPIDPSSKSPEPMTLSQPESNPTSDEA